MRLVVTGREGQVARVLVAVGSAAGLRAIALGQPDLDLERPVTIVPALAAARPAVMVNAAAWTAVDLAEAKPMRAADVNAAGAGEVARAAAYRGVPLIQFSTDYVFVGTKSAPYVEADAVGPTGVYGATKLAGEAAVQAVQPNHAILRTTCVYGPEGRNFLLSMLKLADVRDEVGVVADQIGNPTYAPDLASGIITIAGNRVARPDDATLRGLFKYGGRRRNVLGRLCRSDIQSIGEARWCHGVGPADRHLRLSDAGPAAGEFTARLQQAGRMPWRTAGAVADGARTLPGPASSPILMRRSLWR